MSKYAIAVKNLNVYSMNFFGKRKTKILKNVSFHLPIGKICTFVGHNGAGKTTTIKSILGLKNIASGEIKIFDRNINDILSKQAISYIPEKGNHEPIIVKDFLNSIGQFYRVNKKIVHSRAKAILQYFDIRKSLLNSRLDKLSTGQNKIMMFIQAFISESNLIIADEPTDNLDPENRDLF
jgi:ABC-2 type transport system ATP-binding protein